MNVILMFALLGAPAPGGDRPDDADKLQGTWTAKSVISSGQPRNPEEVKSLRVVIDGKEIRFKWSEKKEVPFGYKLEATAKPKQIDLIIQLEPLKGRVCRSIYELDGDQLKLCINDRTSDKRPTEFKSAPADGLSVFLLERVKK